MKSVTRFGALAAAAILAWPCAALAGPAVTWLEITPSDPAAAHSGTVTGGNYFYKERVTYAAVARLSEVYVMGEGDKALSLPAGEPLVGVESSGQFFCSKRPMRAMNNGDTLALALKYSALGLFTHPSRAASLQCFRDSDGDGAFDEIASGVADFPGPAFLVAGMEDRRKLDKPIRYEKLDPLKESPAMMVGMAFSHRGWVGSRFEDVSLCYGLADLSNAQCFWLERDTLDLDKKARKLDLRHLGGAASLTFDATAVTFNIDKPFSGRFSARGRMKVNGGSMMIEEPMLVTPRP